MPEMSHSGVKRLQILEGHSSDVTCCDFSGHYLATSSSDKSVRIWIQDTNNHFVEASFSPLTGHTYGVNCVRFSPFGTILASCSTDGTVMLWTVENGEKISEIKHSSGSAIRVCCFPQSSTLLATGGDDEKLVLWDISTKSAIRILDGHEAMITACAFTPDSTFLVSCSTAGDIMLWDARYGHGRCLTSYTVAHDLGVLGCDFSSQYDTTAGSGTLNSSYLLATCGNDDLVKLWHIKTGTQCKLSLSATLEGHSGNVMSCRFSVDGTLLASTAGDRTVIIWDPFTGHVLQKLEGHSRYVTCCAFSSNNLLLATGSNDKTVIIWSLDNSKLHDSAYSSPINTICRGSNQERISFSQWTVSDVSDWLEQLGLADLSETFSKHAIDGKELMHLSHDSLLTVMKIETLGHRNKILRAIQALKNPLWQHAVPDIDDISIPKEFHCPITHEVMEDPVIASDGYSYEHSAMKEWFESGNDTSPMTNETLQNKILIPNRILLSLIQKYQV